MLEFSLCPRTKAQNSEGSVCVQNISAQEHDAFSGCTDAAPVLTGDITFSNTTSEPSVEL